jgi:hypothetical protein
LGRSRFKQKAEIGKIKVQAEIGKIKVQAAES